MEGREFLAGEPYGSRGKIGLINVGGNPTPVVDFYRMIPPGVIVNVVSDPQFTCTSPPGLMLPPMPALAVMPRTNGPKLAKIVCGETTLANV